MPLTLAAGVASVSGPLRAADAHRTPPSTPSTSQLSPSTRPLYRSRGPPLPAHPPNGVRTRADRHPHACRTPPGHGRSGQRLRQPHTANGPTTPARAARGGGVRQACGPIRTGPHAVWGGRQEQPAKHAPTGLNRASHTLPPCLPKRRAPQVNTGRQHQGGGWGELPASPAPPRQPPHRSGPSVGRATLANSDQRRPTTTTEPQVRVPIPSGPAGGTRRVSVLRLLSRRPVHARTRRTPTRTTERGPRQPRVAGLARVTAPGTGRRYGATRDGRWQRGQK